MAGLPPKQTTCCIVGGGPAGMMLGFLLARGGVEVVVLEKHADFFRDFRGDTIHPSTLELMSELGLLEEFLKIPHQQFSKLMLSFEGKMVPGPDFSTLPTRCKFLALMPQWDFLNFLAAQGKRYPSLHVQMSSTVSDVVRERGRIVGVRGEAEGVPFEVRAALVVACDGRRSTVREAADLKVEELGVPVDVLWYRLSKPIGTLFDTLGWIRDGNLMITIDRAEYLQCATLIPKGKFSAIQEQGLEAFRKQIAHMVPQLGSVAHELVSWDQVKLLTVQINRLHEWALPGLLCIGDAAHAMSPAGGVGANLAVQDAVATANLLYQNLCRGDVPLSSLQEVQRRREPAVRMIQRIQMFVHHRMFSEAHVDRAVVIPTPVRWLLKGVAPMIRRRAARVVGLGIRPERIETPERIGP